MLLFHSVEGILGILVAIGFILAMRLVLLLRKPYTWCPLILCAVFAILFVFQVSGVLEFPSLGLANWLARIASIGVDVPQAEVPLDKWHQLVEANTPLILAVTFIGTLLMMLPRRFNEPGPHDTRSLGIFNPKYTVMALGICFILYVYTTPEFFSHRAGSTAAPFLAVALGLPVGLTFLWAISLSKQRLRILLTAFGTALLVALAVFAPRPISEHHHASYINGYEYAAIRMFNDDMTRDQEKRTLILSDAKSMMVYSGLTYIQSPLPRLYLESEYDEKYVKYMARLKETLFLGHTDVTEVLEGYAVEHDMHRIIILISGRTIRWFEMDEGFLPPDFYLPQRELSYYDPDYNRFLNRFEGNPRLERIYTEPDELYMWTFESDLVN